jgi:hypothetical protein
MVNFSKILGLVGAATVFAGLSFGQQVCSGPSAAPGLIRVEGTTEQVADLTFTCTGAGAGTANILDILSLPVTSKVLATSGTAYTEALVVVTNPGAPTAYAQGTISGSQINFSGIVLSAGTNTVTVTNVRVNASSLTVGTGTPPAVTESAFISGVGLTAAVLPATPVGYAFTGLSGVTAYKAVGNTSKGVNSFVICQAVNKSTTNAGVFAVLQFGENFAAAFKGQGSAAGNALLGSEFANNTETGFVPGAWPSTVGASNVANSGTLIQVVLSNIPANVAVYAPVVTAADQTPAAGTTLGTITLVGSATGTITAATPLSATSSITAGTAALTVSGGSATAYFLFAPGSASSTTTESFSVPFYTVQSANAVAASTTAVTAAVSFAPIGASNTIPSFVVGPSTVTTTLSTYSGCTTSLLFPFVSNQLGFDTGIAIANTSSDPFGSKGATPQQGICTMYFYGNGAPSPANVATPVVPTGSVYTTVLSSVAAGFQGYIIAQCSFQYAHGFAFIEDGVGPTGGLSQGYLAGVIPDVNQVGSRPASPGTASAAGTGETLGN